MCGYRIVACLIWVPLSLIWGQTVEPYRSVLEPGKGWELVAEGYQLTADSAAARDGSVYFTDARKNRVWKVDADGKVSLFKENSGGTHGITMGSDGRLYAGDHDRKRIVAYSQDGQETVVAEGVQTHHLKVTANGAVYYPDPLNRRIWLLDRNGEKRVVNSEMNWPHGMHVAADPPRLLVTDSRSGEVWSFEIRGDGSLTNGSAFYGLEIPGARSEIDPGGVTMDSEGYVYVGTHIGVQVFEGSGRRVEIIPPPGAAGTSDVFFAGPSLRWLYVTDGERMFRRLVKRGGR